MTQINIARKKEEIKKIWKEHFHRELSIEEIDNKLNNSVKSNIASMKKHESVALIENHINGSDNIFFSPKGLMKELSESIKLLGDKYIDNTQFAEAYTAVQFAIAINKLNGDKLIIAMSDKPDIFLIKMSADGSLAKKPERRAFEVMKCYPDNFHENTFNEDFLEYIRKHKFAKDYGKKSWLVLPFFSRKYDGSMLKNFMNIISDTTEIPFSNIYLTELIENKYEHFKLHRIYPDYFCVEVDLMQDRKFIF